MYQQSLQSLLKAKQLQGLKDIAAGKYILYDTGINMRVYLHPNSIENALKDYADEPKELYRYTRFYGQNQTMVDAKETSVEWLYSTSIQVREKWSNDDFMRMCITPFGEIDKSVKQLFKHLDTYMKDNPNKVSLYECSQEVDKNIDGLMQDLADLKDMASKLTILSSDKKFKKSLKYKIRKALGYTYP